MPLGAVGDGFGRLGSVVTAICDRKLEWGEPPGRGMTLFRNEGVRQACR